MTSYILQFTITIFAAILTAAIFEARHAKRPLTAVAAGVASLIALAITFSLSTRSAPQIGVTITVPQNGHQVPQRTLVTGQLQNPRAKLWLLVRPIELDTWWVQEAPVIQSDGTWSGYINVGTATEGVGKSFELLAVATDENQLELALRGGDLKTSQQLKFLTAYFAKSRPVVIQRQNK